jgi:hypothetical protein
MLNMESKPRLSPNSCKEKDKALQQEQQSLQKQLEEEGRRLQDAAERKNP